MRFLPCGVHQFLCAWVFCRSTSRNLISLPPRIWTTKTFAYFCSQPFETSQWQPTFALSTPPSSVDHCVMIPGRSLISGQSIWSFSTISWRYLLFEWLRSPNRGSFKKMIVTEMRWTDWRRKELVVENFMPLVGEILDIGPKFFGRTASLDLLKENKSFRKWQSRYSTFLWPRC